MTNRTTVHLPFARGNPVRVLMADQDESRHPFYRESLRSEGFEVDVAVNGLECVARLRARAPHVLVLELLLPWGGGEGVLAVMGEDPDLAVVPVMVLTSCRDPDLLKGVSRFPISDYQLKPLAPDRLAERLRTLLTHPRPSFTLDEQNVRLEYSIARRTGRRLFNLGVETVGGRVVVHGRSHSHYIRQLALAAVTEAIEASEFQPDKIVLDIEVVPVDSRQSRQIPAWNKGTEGCSNEFDFVKKD